MISRWVAFILLIKIVLLIVWVLYRPLREASQAKKKHTQIFYYLANNRSLEYTFRRELKKLLKSRVDKNVSILAHVGNLGVFSYSSQSWSKLSGNCLSLEEFVNICAQKSRESRESRDYVFWYGGHSEGFYIRPTDDEYWSLSKLRRVLSRLPHLQYLIFDSCCMASVECVYEFRDLADYIIATPEYCGDDGFLSKRIFDIFDNIHHIPSATQFRRIECKSVDFEDLIRRIRAKYHKLKPVVKGYPPVWLTRDLVFCRDVSSEYMYLYRECELYNKQLIT